MNILKSTCIISAMLMGSVLTSHADVNLTFSPSDDMAAATRADLTQVTEPKGEDMFYSVHTKGYILYQSQPVSNEAFHPAHIWYDGDDVYMENPVPSARIFSYIKGKKEGNVISMTFPQFLGTVYDQYGNPHKYYVNVVELDVTQRGDRYECEYWTAAEDTTVQYIIADDGSITMEIPGAGIDETVELPTHMLAICYSADPMSKYAWSGFADWYERYEPATEETQGVQLPDGLETEKWAIVYGGEGRLVNVAFDGNDVYVGNLTNSLPDAYVKGVIADGTATFPKTYLGISEQYNEYVWFSPATWKVMEDPITHETLEDYVVAENFVFDYDPENRKFTNREENAAIFVTPTTIVGDQIPAYFEYFYEPDIVWQNPATADGNPCNPEFLDFCDMKDYLGCDQIEFDLPCFNVYGNFLDVTRMYYNFYIDGEKFTFLPDEYYGLSESLVDVPYSFTDPYNDIYCYGRDHQISVFALTYETVGVQLFYEALDGTVYKSDLVETTIKDLLDKIGGVDEVAAAGELTGVVYTTPDGIRTANPGRGLYIKTETYADGTVRTTKVISSK